jgi:small subunit ribosomal protein S17
MLKTRGNEIEGTVVSDKAKKTVIIEHAYTTFLKKYERSLRKTSRMHKCKDGRCCCDI